MTDAPTRRDVIRRAGRWAFGAALGGWLVAATGRTRTGGIEQLCPRCPSLGTCRLPAGVRARERSASVPAARGASSVELCREDGRDG
jgi:hypothetical protein